MRSNFLKQKTAEVGETKEDPAEDGDADKENQNDENAGDEAERRRRKDLAMRTEKDYH